MKTNARFRWLAGFVPAGSWTTPSGPAVDQPSSIWTAVKHLPSPRQLRHRRLIAKWLVRCADPLGPRANLPRRALSPRQANELVADAAAHGVIPAVLRNFPPFAGDPDFETARSEAVAHQRLAVSFAMMLRHHGEELLKAAKGLPVAIVKGATFARTIYPSPQLRPFTDIDLLVSPEATREIGQILEAQGFEFVEEGHDPARREWKWAHRTNTSLFAEVHTNLVHAPSLQHAMSLAYEDLAEFGLESPASLLAVAVVHGALHQFERLRHVVDICQAARALRTSGDERQFQKLMARSGGMLAAKTGLALAYRLFREPRCREIARALGPVRHFRIATLLVGRAVITSTMNEQRVYHSWRRQGFRELLKKGQLPGPGAAVEKPAQPETTDIS